MLDLTYRDLRSPVHRLGISTKAVLFGWLCVLSLLYSDLLFLSSLIAGCVALSLLGRVGASTARFMRFLMAFTALVLVINIVANQHGEHTVFKTTFRFYWWRVNFQLTLESLSSAVQMVLRLWAVILTFLVFTLTTKPESMLRRLSGVRGLEGLGLLLALSYRFLPTVFSDGVRIRDSLRSRGVQFEEGNRLDRARAYSSLGIPLIVNSLDRSLQLAEALESRGYASSGRTKVGVSTPSLSEALLASYYVCAGLVFLGLWVCFDMGRATIFVRWANTPAAAALLASFIAPVVLWRSLT